MDSSHNDGPKNPRRQRHLEEALAQAEGTRLRQEASRTPPILAWARPGEGDPSEMGAPVNWNGMLDDEFDDTFGALGDFLAWAVPRWNFTTEQFPYKCWWQHPDILEEMTAWWGMWQAYIRNPRAHLADAIAFHERTGMMKQRLGDSYRGRCRHKHEPAPAPPDVAAAPHNATSVQGTPCPPAQ